MICLGENNINNEDNMTQNIFLESLRTDERKPSFASLLKIQKKTTASEQLSSFLSMPPKQNIAEQLIAGRADPRASFFHAIMTS